MEIQTQGVVVNFVTRLPKCPQLCVNSGPVVGRLSNGVLGMNHPHTAPVPGGGNFPASGTPQPSGENQTQVLSVGGGAESLEGLFPHTLRHRKASSPACQQKTIAHQSKL